MPMTVPDGATAGSVVDLGAPEEGSGTARNFRDLGEWSRTPRSPSVLELDHHFQVVLDADIAGPLHSPTLHPDDGTGNHVRFEVVAERPFRLRFGNHGDPVTGHLDEEVVEPVSVHCPFLAG